MAKIKAPKGVTSISWGGQEYKANAAGNISVPNDRHAAIMAELASHGFAPPDGDSADDVGPDGDKQPAGDGTPAS
ncbi:hypothetical protein [Nitrospirillum amazonense]|uniref:hypothetical protein n=1 Tax=Nitrospirillum amazonense TaxID=28077 RepID=UPI0024122EA0|nr:hypothetical protein [Nitrospirillum amazonense]MDG3442438.1 hypothetical protein [Nitrospirillum amazonense]